MEFKPYDKPWLPAFKGAFLILFGIIAMLQIFGSIRTLAVFFDVLIGMIAILLISTSILFKNTRFRGWTAIQGIINLGFVLYLSFNMDAQRSVIVWCIFTWILFYALSEIIEAGLLMSMGNAFFALFLLNAVLTLSFAYFMYQLKGNTSEQAVFYVGVIALVFGIVNQFSAYLLSRLKS